MDEEPFRSKREVAREIELSRKEMKRSWRGATYAWSHRNPALRAWKATKKTASRTKDKVVTQTYHTDEIIRANIYSALGISLAIGAIAGLLLRRRKKLKAACC